MVIGRMKAASLSSVGSTGTTTRPVVCTHVPLPLRWATHFKSHSPMWEPLSVLPLRLLLTVPNGQSNSPHPPLHTPGLPCRQRPERAPRANRGARHHRNRRSSIRRWTLAHATRKCRRICGDSSSPTSFMQYDGAITHVKSFLGIQRYHLYTQYPSKKVSCLAPPRSQQTAALPSSCP
jgi:hypothetical protein